VRGFGFWIWKPQVIIQALRSVKNGQIVLYLDVGCHLNRLGVPRLREYFEIVSSSNSGILAFDCTLEGTVDQKEVMWTKSDTLDFFEALSNEKIKQSAQIAATIILVEKRESTVKFFENWLNLMGTHRNLIDDSPSLIQNDPSFVENRHDQSMFSILGKFEDIAILSYEENLPHWRDAKFMPIQARRDKARLREKFLFFWRNVRVIKLLISLRTIPRIKDF
jgi:hypothetical protein